MTLKALDIFRIQQNGPSNAFFSRNFHNQQTNGIGISCAHAESGETTPSK